MQVSVRAKVIFTPDKTKENIVQGLEWMVDRSSSIQSDVQTKFAVKNLLYR